MMQRYLRAAITLLAMLVLLSGGLVAKGKGEKLYKDGQAAEAKQDWDAALDLYLKALDEKPNDPLYMISMRRARFQAGAKHVSAGQKFRLEGKLEEALNEFRRALIADPSSSIAIQELRHTQDAI